MTVGLASGQQDDDQILNLEGFCSKYSFKIYSKIICDNGKARGFDLGTSSKLSVICHCAKFGALGYLPTNFN